MGASVNSITPLDLMPAIGSPPDPIILDVRRVPVFDVSPDTIATASWRDPAKVEEWLQAYPVDGTMWSIVSMEMKSARILRHHCGQRVSVRGTLKGALMPSVKVAAR